MIGNALARHLPPKARDMQELDIATIDLLGALVAPEPHDDRHLG